MIYTILNLGLNDKSVEVLAKRSDNPRFGADSYRRLIQMFGHFVLDIEKSAFDEVIDAKKRQKKTYLDTDLDARTLQEVVVEYKEVDKKTPNATSPKTRMSNWSWCETQYSALGTATGRGTIVVSITSRTTLVLR